MFYRIITLYFIIISTLLCSFSLYGDTSGTVLITGANRGIGLALAERFSRAGYDVIGTARKPGRASELAELDVRVERLDVSSQASVEELVEQLGDTPIDILINNAGIKGDDSKLMDGLDVDEIARVLDVNTLGPLRVTQALFGNLRQEPHAVVANVSSMMGSMEMNTWGCCVGYRASKAALNSVTSTMAVDYGGDGLVFVALHPGYVQTDMNEGRGNVTPKDSADGLFRVITGLEAGDNGKFYDFQGKALPW
ncbi:MAG: SDR family oxidoreductase [Gammaproteobacteria bacterium]|nr:SDR family oxidoreductase [Gammaproteobacteria bacterium]